MQRLILVGLLVASLLFTRHSDGANIYSSEVFVSKVDSFIEPTPLFYGLSAEEILYLPQDSIRPFCTQKSIRFPSFLAVRKEAENYLVTRQIQSDSMSTNKLYDQLDKELGISE